MPWKPLLQSGLALAALALGAVLFLKPPPSVVNTLPEGHRPLQALELSGQLQEFLDAQEEEPQEPPTAESESSAEISNEYIQRVLDRQRRFFSSCFLKYFERKQGQVQAGLVVFHVVIENSGRVRTAEVLESDIQDEGFTSCLQSVLERSRLRPFEGPTLHVEYPIELRAP